MKKILSRLLVFCVIAAFFWFAVFAWKNLRGIKPALRSAPENIASIIEQAPADQNRAAMPLSLPSGFSISVFAKGLGGPRVMVLDPDDTLVVSIPSQGRVVALPDRDHDGTADRVVPVRQGLNRPHGLAFRCAPGCSLFIAEENGVSAYAYDRASFKAVHRKKLADLPDDGGHWTRTLLLLPKPHDDRLLVSVGSSCNVCEEDDWRRAKILAVPAGGGTLTAFASGLRNPVFMAVHPRTGRVWATEMGRDLLGDERPPDEINIIEEGRDYGWPYCFGKNVYDSDFDPRLEHRCGEPGTVLSHIDIPAHSAPLGLAFFPEQGWPAEFKNNLLVAYHGSWNRSTPTGYKIVRYRLDETGAYRGVEDFVTGWLTKEGTALGRPVGIVIKKDGTIFVSDDKAGVVYRISRKTGG